MQAPSIAAIVLAAGKSSRFGSNKLLTQLGEKSVLSYTLEKLLQLPLKETIVVANKVTMPDIPYKERLTLVLNEVPEQGISHSIQLGIEAATQVDGYLFMVGDQPLLTVATLEGLLQAYTKATDCIIGVGKKSELGNPVIFPMHYKSSLMTLTGDKGGKSLIKKHQLPYKVYEVIDEAELWDMDCKEDYEAMKRRMANGIIKA